MEKVLFVPKHDNGDRQYGDYIVVAPERVAGAKEEMLQSLLHTVKDLVDQGNFLFTKNAPNGNVIVGWKLLVPGEIAAPAKPEFVKAVTNFGDALEAMKDGERVARKGWNGNGMYVFLAHEADFVTDADISAFDQMEVEVADMLVMKTAQDTFQPGWLASQTDMLAEDWYIVE